VKFTTVRPGGDDADIFVEKAKSGQQDIVIGIFYPE
jgi:hypothetical protein